VVQELLQGSVTDDLMPRSIGSIQMCEGVTLASLSLSLSQTAGDEHRGATAHERLTVKKRGPVHGFPGEPRLASVASSVQLLFPRHCSSTYAYACVELEVPHGGS